MKIEVKGHSGCQIDVITEQDGIFVYKSTADPKYLVRLSKQAEKQRVAAEVQYPHIRVPKVFEIQQSSDTCVVKMQYVYSKNFIEFFQQAGFEQVDYLIGALEYFIEYEIGKSKLQQVPASIFQDKFAEIRSKCEANPLYQGDETIADILVRASSVFDSLGELLIPVGLSHGDLTFSNILFNGNNYYLIDFLDSFIETPLQDIVKIRQDTAHRWSQLMYTKPYDEVRLHIICDKIDQEIDTYFSNKYQWYRDYYQVMQLMNILRILPYAYEQKVIEYLKQVLSQILILIGKAQQLPEEVPYREVNGEQQVRNLLVPVAADKEEYSEGLPYLFGLDKDGITICLKSILGMNLSQFDHIYFTILKKHDEKYYLSENLHLQFKRLGLHQARVVVLDESTDDQAETIYRTIQQEGIEGGLFVKDADSYFTTEASQVNGIAIFPIEELEVLSPKDKSYVAVDDMYYVTNIIEKSVIGHYISAGGYVFNVNMFKAYYQRLRGYGRLYLSHLIYAMLLDKQSFRPIMVEDYKDWGTRNDWNRYE